MPDARGLHHDVCHHPGWVMNLFDYGCGGFVTTVEYVDSTESKDGRQIFYHLIDGHGA